MVKDFFITNFFLLCLVLGMSFMAIQNYKMRKKDALVPVLIGGTALVLAVLVALEEYGKVLGNVALTTTMCMLGYIIRPFELLFFMELAGSKRRVLLSFLILLGVNVLVYLTSICFFYEPLSHLAFWYEVGPQGILEHHRGYLNFTSHIISAFMLFDLMLRSLLRLKGQHRFDALSILICAVFVVGSVILEMFSIGTNLLNTTIAISCLFYYLFLYVEANRKDALTGLFERKSYYSDLKRMERYITAVAAMDMNGLKEINDHQGHDAGDKAIVSCANSLNEAVGKNQYVYRMGGDEFLLLYLGKKKEDFEKTIEKIRANMAKTDYSLSIGCCYRDEENCDFEAMMRKAELEMYADKAGYYEESGKDRRKH